MASPLTAAVYKRTPLRVSTMVVTANFSTPLNISELFANIHHAVIPLWYPSEGILKIEHKDKVIGESYRDALTKRKISDKCFFNQATLVVRKINPSNGEWKEVNLKLFANGGVQVTGIVSKEFAEDVLQWTIKELAQLPGNTFTTPPAISKFAVQLINSDFKVGAMFNRDKLHELLTRRYGLLSMLESTIYQGVNTKYYYNKSMKDKTRPGQCLCNTFCKGQGTGDGEGECKRVTMSFFQTGNIIITGARDMDQINEAYVFVNKFLDAHAAEIVRPCKNAENDI
jgi:TATA-box binding protein (TBP) (component of TFIID and TFIIIB)